MDVQDVNNIYCLPDEIIVMILQNITPRDILNFGATCKQYNDLVLNHISLWKSACAKKFSPILYNVIEEYHGSNWLHEMKCYSKLKKKLNSELIAMSPKHYWMLSERSLDNVNNFFTILTKTNFFYAVHILQELIKTGNKMIDKYEVIKPYTLTEMYYSKTVLRHFIHTYLAVKWAKAKVEEDLPPELVINFFLQWIDPANLYLDQEVQKKINTLAEQVKEILRNDKKASRGHSSGIQIIQAVTHVIYKQSRMVLTTATDVDTLDICKVIDSKCGNVIVVAAIYQAVATRCGACCELIVFPNHLFLEWNDSNQLYNIDLGTGDVYPKRQCPFAFSQSNPTTKYSYCPDSLLQYIYSSFVITMGALRTWNTQNATYLLDFLGTENEHSAFKHNPYKKYFSHLMENDNTLKLSGNVNIKQVSDGHIQLITSLANLNNVDAVPTKKKIAKKHAGSVKYAVGMICYHKRYEYVCVIRGWDVTGCQLHFPLDDLYYGRNQPFYYITAADQSERYVAQVMQYQTFSTRTRDICYKLMNMPRQSVSKIMAFCWDLDSWELLFHSVQITHDIMSLWIVYPPSTKMNIDYLLFEFAPTLKKASENLIQLTRPTRLYHLEHQISRDFTHFDGFAYALNDQKKLEYPEDVPIIELFRILCRQKPNNI